MSDSAPAGDKPLFTPGPLTTSLSVKQAMLHDVGSRDERFLDVVRRIRERLLALGGVSRASGYEAVLMQGSGTFAIEAVISSITPPDGKWLVVINGAYGERMLKIAQRYRIPAVPRRCPENALPDLAAIERCLQSDRSITHVSVVHCETTSGIMNPIDEIGRIVAEQERSFLVDSMSAFGAVPLSLDETRIDWLVSSANKCIESVPGFAFVLCRRSALEASSGQARTMSLDLYEQWRGLEGNGQFRFTPPTHAILAFDQALNELDQEGGVSGRAGRYRANHQRLVQGMRRLGFVEYVPPELQGSIITSFLYPDHARFEFQRFYERLRDLGFIIYPGKVSDADCFRIGNIGHIFEAQIDGLLRAIETTLVDMGLQPTAAPGLSS